MSTAASDLAMSVAVIGKILEPHGGSSAAYRQLVADVDRVVQELLTAEATGRAAVRALDRLYPAIATRVIVLEQSGEEKAAAAWNEEAKMVAAVLATDTARGWLAEEGPE